MGYMRGDDQDQNPTQGRRMYLLQAERRIVVLRSIVIATYAYSTYLSIGIEFLDTLSIDRKFSDLSSTPVDRENEANQRTEVYYRLETSQCRIGTPRRASASLSGETS